MKSISKQKIVPHLWFDTQAKEAAEFYVKAFGGDSAITQVTVLPDTPSGNAVALSFKLRGYNLAAISAGPYFKINPAVSFMLNFDPLHNPQAREELTALWTKLAAGGQVRMPLGAYPFSEYYGWIEDKYGVSWQLILSRPEGEPRPFIVPSLMFTKDMAGRAEEAIKFYMSVFHETQLGTTARYPAGLTPDQEGMLMFADFQLEGQWFAAMDSAGPHEFKFNEGLSFMIKCANQEELDYYFAKLSAVPEAEQCGWLKDKFGLSWQVVPTVMDEMMATGSPEQIARVTKAFLPMKKFDLVTLQAAFDAS